MENDTTTTDTTVKVAPSHPDCVHCQLNAAFRAMIDAGGGPYEQVAFLEKRKELLGE